MLQGAGQRPIFRRICLPIAIPGVAVCGILSSLSSWNGRLFAYILKTKAAKKDPVLAVTLMEGYDVPVLIFALPASGHPVRGLTTGFVK